MQLGDDNPKKAARPNLDFMAVKYYAIAAFGSATQVYPCLNLGDGADGDAMDMKNDLSDIFRRFLRPPEWLCHVP